MAYRLYACSVCDTKAPLQLQLRLVALYKCYVFACVFAAPAPLTCFVGDNNELPWLLGGLKAGSGRESGRKVTRRKGRPLTASSYTLMLLHRHLRLTLKPPSAKKT